MIGNLLFGALELLPSILIGIMLTAKDTNRIIKLGFVAVWLMLLWLELNLG